MLKRDENKIKMVVKEKKSNFLKFCLLAMD